jgi:chemotaxis methyl-accepting protein methylase
MKDELARVVAVMGRVHGIDLAIYDEDFLAKSVDRRMAGLAADTAGYLSLLEKDSTESAQLFRSMDVSFSEFFRDPLVFALLEQVILPAVANRKVPGSEIRVWSAGCAAGEEPYSVAILLDELSASRPGGIPYRIFATDAHEDVLATARAGIYAAPAVRNVRLKHLESGFTRLDGAYVVAPRLRERIEFSRHDLLDPHSDSPAGSIFGDFDVICCRNLLMYYRPETRRFILEKLCRSLAGDGYLVAGEVERVIIEGMAGLVAEGGAAPVFRRIATGG